MPRASRHFLPGYVWHITHRCHQREFLLKHACDRRRWLYWLAEATRRYRLSVLGYAVTCNHVHLLVQDRGCGEIARSLQLVAGRTAQDYNRRRGRLGAYWQDRYHATAIETSTHLVRCLVYIDLNMVRAGGVRHPSEWPEAGYAEIQGLAKSCRVLDRDTLLGLLAVPDWESLRRAHSEWIEDALQRDPPPRRQDWSSALALGSPAFVEEVKARLGARGRSRRVTVSGDASALREESAEYGVGPGEE